MSTVESKDTNEFEKCLEFIIASNKESIYNNYITTISKMKIEFNESYEDLLSNYEKEEPDIPIKVNIDLNKKDSHYEKLMDLEP